jgi:NTE family protein
MLRRTKCNPDRLPVTNVTTESILTDYKTISLGLQGGGTYGAFGWGVLDRLLQEEWLVIEALSGTSAGAVNAVVLADGYAHGGGREGARKALNRFWRTLGRLRS